MSQAEAAAEALAENGTAVANAVATARTEAVVSALQLVCNAIGDNNATLLGDAVRHCPPENTTALSTALAQAAADEGDCSTVAAVSSKAF